MTEVDPLTLDIADIFTGTSLPETTVDVNVNAQLAHAVALLKARIEVATATSNTDEAERLEKELEALYEEGEKFRFTFRIQGTPLHVRDELIATVREQFPEETDIFGRVKANAQADKEFSIKWWTAHVREITRASTGATKVPTEADIRIFRAQAPDAAQRKIDAAITDIIADTDAGFESLAQAHDFLSQP